MIWPRPMFHSDVSFRMLLCEQAKQLIFELLFDYVRIFLTVAESPSQLSVLRSLCLDQKLAPGPIVSPLCPDFVHQQRTPRVAFQDQGCFSACELRSKLNCWCFSCPNPAVACPPLPALVTRISPPLLYLTPLRMCHVCLSAAYRSYLDNQTQD
jgi:hypothetical protein